MKTKFLILALALALSYGVNAQETYDDLVKVGDELTIGAPAGNSYEYLEVPKKNFIIKKGGIANLSSISKAKVTVTKLTYDKNSKAIVTLKRSNGSKFFNAFRTLKADLNGAVANGELILKQTAGTKKVAK